MNPRYAFASTDLTTLLELDLTDPADQADIETIQDILLRRGTPGTTGPLDNVPKRSRARSSLHLVPDPTI